MIDNYKCLQEKMRNLVNILDDNTGISVEKIFSVDVQYGEEFAYVAVDYLNLGTNEHRTYATKEKLTVGYHPGLFCFREGPVLKSAIEKVMQKLSIRPDLIIVDGHGIAHPRNFGVASWLGIELNLPTIGCAKKSLINFADFPGNEKFNSSEIVDKNKRLGYILRSVKNVKPIFVSAGHRISSKQSLEIIKSLVGNYRVIEPIRRADSLCRAYAKGEIAENLII